MACQRIGMGTPLEKNIHFVPRFDSPVPGSHGAGKPEIPIFPSFLNTQLQYLF